MRGIASFAHERGVKGVQWHVYSAPEGEEGGVFFTAAYPWDGVIVRPGGEGVMERVMALGVPVVAVGSARLKGRGVNEIGRGPAGVPRVKVDDAALVESVVKYLVGRVGVRRLGYCSFSSEEDRGEAMMRLATQNGLEVEMYQGWAREVSEFAGKTTKIRRGGQPQRVTLQKIERSLSWQERQKDLARWVKQVAKKGDLTGILCWNPDVACQLVEACHLAGVKVPGQVAVIAADEDKFKCELTRPTITSTPIPAARIGYEAAALLDRLMDGRDPPREALLVKPSGVVKVRGSTQVEGIGAADRDVEAAVRLMEQAIGSGKGGREVNVNEVARKVGVSRRWLERHFVRVLGCAPGEKMRQLRIERARVLLSDTNWTIGKVARGVGVKDTSYFVKLFKGVVGLTPAEFRASVRVK